MTGRQSHVGEISSYIIGDLNAESRAHWEVTYNGMKSHSFVLISFTIRIARKSSCMHWMVAVALVLWLPLFNCVL
jgi:hypothetical protein